LQAERYHRFIKSYKCRGSIYLSDRQHFDCDFECGQTEEGDIIVLLGFCELDSMFRFWGGLDSALFVSGYTHDGQHVRANIAVSGSIKISSDLNGISNEFEFHARDLTVDEIKPTPITALKFYIVNFKFIKPLKWHLGGYNVAVEKVSGYAQAEEEMRATKRPKMTTELTITSPDDWIANEYEVQRIVRDLCDLLSLAKGCQVQWLYWDAFTSDDVRIKSYHWDGVTTPYATWDIILEKPREDIADFIQQTFQRYREVNAAGIWKFDEAISHYADTVSRNSLLELRANNLVVLVDYLTQSYAASEKTTYFVQPARFEDKKEELQNLISCAIACQFSAEDLVKNEPVSMMKKGAKRGTVNQMVDLIDCFNRRSFPSLLKRLMKHLDLVVDKDEIEMFKNIRNKLVHESNFLKPNDFREGSLYESPWYQFRRIFSLTSRIMLAIIQYRGYYYDWKMWKEAEWAGAETGRVKMPYAEAPKAT
jgi:hypothetical protein